MQFTVCSVSCEYDVMNSDSAIYLHPLVPSPSQPDSSATQSLNHGCQQEGKPNSAPCQQSRISIEVFQKYFGVPMVENKIKIKMIFYMKCDYIWPHLGSCARRSFVYHHICCSLFVVAKKGFKSTGYILLCELAALVVVWVGRPGQCWATVQSPHR